MHNKIENLSATWKVLYRKPTLDWVNSLPLFCPSYAVFVASLVICPTRFCSPVSLVRPIRVRLVRRSAKSNNAHKKTSAETPVSTQEILTTVTIATALTPTIGTDTEKGPYLTQA